MMKQPNNNVYIFFLLVSLLIPFFGISQETWFFGINSSGIKFDPGTSLVTPHNVHAPLSIEGSGIVMLPNGNDFLFYTAGDSVYNNSHEVIENGFGILGWHSSIQPIAIIPKPGSCNQYYVFTNSAGHNSLFSKLFVSTVDMNANEGKGAIFPGQKNVIVRDSVQEGMVAFPKPNGEDYWLIGVDSSFDKTHFVYSITSTGIELTSEYNFGNHYGHFGMAIRKIDNNQARVAGCYRNEGKQIYSLDFDLLNGNLENYLVIDSTFNNAYDVEWSPNGDKLYYSKSNYGIVNQYDFLNQMITPISPNPVIAKGGGLKLGPDGKIYHIGNIDTTLLSIIHNPNAAGTSCDYDEFALDVGGYIKGLNFPEVAVATNYIDPNNSNIITGVINDYVKVIDTCNNNIVVDDASSFHLGDKVLLIQMQGALANTSNSVNFGNILSYENAGNYEFNEIRSIEGNSILLKNKRINSYSFDGKVQLIRVPNLGDATVCSLTCKPWDGETGGVLAFVGGKIEMQSDIDVSGKGFRGGDYVNGDGVNCSQNPFYFFSESEIDSAAYRGEGIASFLSFPLGPGNFINAGGGGKNHNCGGGGGGNYGGGGGGGYWIGNFPCNLDTLIVLEGIGKGGIPVSFLSLPNKIFLGGGGGAGHSNNGRGSAGGNGGGIIFAIIDELVSNGNTIKANGDNSISHYTYPRNIDGGGGGGAGGSIYLDILSQNITKVEAKGGKGCSVHDTHGHGGGGGGGILLKANGNVDLIATGGASGIGIEGNKNEAKDGGNGTLISSYNLIASTTEYEPLLFDDLIFDTNCDTTGNLTVVPSGGDSNYEYSLSPLGNWGIDSIYNGLSEGDYLLELRDQCLNIDTLIFLDTYPFLEIDTVINQFMRCDSLGHFEVVPTGGLPPYKYRVLSIDSTWQSIGYFGNLTSGIYDWEVQDARGCSIDGQVFIKNETEDLIVQLPFDQQINVGTTIELIPEITASVPTTFFYNWSLPFGLSCTNCEIPAADPLVSTTYHLEVEDIFGCYGQDSIVILVDPNSVYIPNAFSPDKNGINDFLYVQGDPTKIKCIRKFRVWNRWGDLLFMKQNFQPNDPTLGWDGTLNGKELNNQVLVYYVEVEYVDGIISSQKGDVSIIK